MSRTIKKAKTGAKAVSRSCCNHGTCDYCLSNRMHKHNKKLIQERENIHETEAKALPSGTDCSDLSRSDAPRAEE